MLSINQNSGKYRYIDVNADPYYSKGGLVVLMQIWKAMSLVM
jgi:hypothetical protein